jgi:hypothetical protein
MARISFKVSFVLPEAATVANAREYVVNAVSTLKGGLQPPGHGPGGYDPDEDGDPMFELDEKTVRVVRIK